MSCVYRLNIENCDDNYIGSCVDLHKRKISHKHNCYNEKSHNYNYKLYQFIREKNYEWKSVNFVILEQHNEILDNLSLRKREQQFINDLKPTLNHKKAYRTTEELKEYKKKGNKKYREENPEYHKEKSKKHREENREDILKKNKEYREANKAKINKKCDCKCGGKYTHQHKLQHIKTKKHQDYLDNLDNLE